MVRQLTTPACRPVVYLSSTTLVINAVVEAPSSTLRHLRLVTAVAIPCTTRTHKAVVTTSYHQKRAESAVETYLTPHIATTAVTASFTPNQKNLNAAVNINSSTLKPNAVRGKYSHERKPRGAATISRTSPINRCAATGNSSTGLVMAWPVVATACTNIAPTSAVRTKCGASPTQEAPNAAPHGRTTTDSNGVVTALSSPETTARAAAARQNTDPVVKSAAAARSPMYRHPQTCVAGTRSLLRHRPVTAVVSTWLMIPRLTYVVRVKWSKAPGR